MNFNKPAWNNSVLVTEPDIKPRNQNKEKTNNPEPKKKRESLMKLIEEDNPQGGDQEPKKKIKTKILPELKQNNSKNGAQ